MISESSHWLCEHAEAVLVAAQITPSSIAITSMLHTGTKARACTWRFQLRMLPSPGGWKKRRVASVEQRDS